MDLTLIGGPSRTRAVVILGAGASRGASFVKESSSPVPPLDIDFFTQLQHARQTKASRSLLQFVRSEFGLRLSMEEFYSQADYTDRFYTSFKVDRGRSMERYSKALDAFYRCVPLLFRHAIGQSRCSFHDAVVASLHVEDAVISFNYDCLIDASFHHSTKRGWDPMKKGYGCPVRVGAEHWSTEFSKHRSKRSIELLKPHGSLNWEPGYKKGLKLVDRPYYIKTAKDRIIPPTWFKELTKEPFASVWKRTRLVLRECAALVVIGYSVPPTDLYSRALFRAELSGSRLRTVVLVNPDRGARQRFLDRKRSPLASGGARYSA